MYMYMNWSNVHVCMYSKWYVITWKVVIRCTIYTRACEHTCYMLEMHIRYVWLTYGNVRALIDSYNDTVFLRLYSLNFQIKYYLTILHVTHINQEFMIQLLRGQNREEIWRAYRSFGHFSCVQVTTGFIYFLFQKFNSKQVNFKPFTWM